MCDPRTVQIGNSDLNQLGTRRRAQSGCDSGRSGILVHSALYRLCYDSAQEVLPIGVSCAVFSKPHTL
jgi:hypothetical protein